MADIKKDDKYEKKEYGPAETLSQRKGVISSRLMIEEVEVLTQK
jgi:hypothetical protein